MVEPSRACPPMRRAAGPGPGQPPARRGQRRASAPPTGRSTSVQRQRPGRSIPADGGSAARQRSRPIARPPGDRSSASRLGDRRALRDGKSVVGVRDRRPIRTPAGKSSGRAERVAFALDDQRRHARAEQLVEPRLSRAGPAGAAGTPARARRGAGRRAVRQATRRPALRPPSTTAVRRAAAGRSAAPRASRRPSRAGGAARPARRRPATAARPAARVTRCAGSAAASATEVAGLDAAARTVTEHERRDRGRRAAVVRPPAPSPSAWGRAARCIGQQRVVSGRTSVRRDQRLVGRDRLDQRRVRRCCTLPTAVETGYASSMPGAAGTSSVAQSSGSVRRVEPRVDVARARRTSASGRGSGRGRRSASVVITVRSSDHARGSSRSRSSSRQSS